MLISNKFLNQCDMKLNTHSKTDVYVSSVIQAINVNDRNVILDLNVTLQI